MTTFNQEVFDRLRSRFQKIHDTSVAQNTTREDQLEAYLAAVNAEIIAVQQSSRTHRSSELLSIDEVAARTRICKAIIQRMSQPRWRARYNETDPVWQAFPPAVRFGRRVFYKKDEIEEWIEFCQSPEAKALKSQRRETRGRKRKSPQKIAAAVEAQIAGGKNAAI